MSHRLFAGLFFGSIGGWYFLGSPSKYPIMALPLLLLWIIFSFVEKRGNNKR